MNHENIVTKINNILPQTQCRLCTYKDCLSYAKAVAKGDRLDRCIPGSDQVIIDIAKIIKKDPSPFLGKIKQKDFTTVEINQDDCIGCLKCIMECPVDAILGARQYLHEVISQECTGCNLCVAACPTDCISSTDNLVEYNKNLSKKRYENKQLRLSKKSLVNTNIENSEISIKSKQEYINKILRKDVIKSQNS